MKPTKPKILIDCTIKGSGGSVTYYKNLVNRLEYLGEKHGDIQFIYLVNDGLKHLFNEEVLNNSIFVSERKLKGFKRYLWLFNNIKKIKDKYYPDVFFVPYQVSIGFRHIPQILMLRNMEPFGFRKYPYLLNDKLRNILLEKFSLISLKNSSKIIAVSKFVESFLLKEKKVPSNKIVSIYHGIEDDYAAYKEDNLKNILSKKFSINTPFILSSGSFRPYRRYEDVIEAYNIFKATKGIEDQTLLVLVGRGLKNYETSIKNKIENSPYKDKIKYLGFVEKQSMVSLYKYCKVYIASTEIEACPNIAIESMACGCPIISVKSEPLKEIFKNSALYYNQRDIKELSNKLISLYNDEDLQKVLSNKALERVKDFSWQKCAEETYTFLKYSVNSILERS